MPSKEWPVVWAAVREERRALIDDLTALRPEQWATPSLCPGWDVHDVLAHLVSTAKTTRWRFLRGMVTARFDFDRDNAAGIARERAATPAGTLAEFRRVVDETKTPPAAPATRLVEAIVHGEDIRRPLGISREYPIEHVATALRYQLKTPAAMGGGKQRAEGSRLVAVDSGDAAGSGDVVRGSGLSLLLAVSGRPVHPDEFTGEGAAAFLSRLAIAD
ncbi:maleylpyruvate isomerase family mycothiol-dependent enzyme [Arthrobacter sp. Sa2BUA2]|uniref:Maleylpyruvate isomerase family mycothiol-dependent enzyme n=1 Tax=Arthrobacter pullicola TaxID=2762224 RepID=A0ABR8YKX5_9MICC|nr:maleylpyruvate isomerase family mycothiol-dependent enzyme [Arthrobacter pullicola]MBD8044893.1 maleylpyruvate isomerase family mycothiol-dependent enzyme [Arthrobacter pullicola]